MLPKTQLQFSLPRRDSISRIATPSNIRYGSSSLQSGMPVLKPGTLMHSSNNLGLCRTLQYLQAVCIQVVDVQVQLCMSRHQIRGCVLGAMSDSAVSLKLLGVGVSHRECVCRVIQRGLHCIQQLTAAEWLKQPQHRGLLQAFVRAFGRQSDSPVQEPHGKTGVTKAPEVSSYSPKLDTMAKFLGHLRPWSSVVF